MFKFRTGDAVAWTSQSAGSVKQKTGVIIAVVPAGTVISKLKIDGVTGKVYGQDYSSIDRYLVKVGNKWYTPRKSIIEEQN